MRHRTVLALRNRARFHWRGASTDPTSGWSPGGCAARAPARRAGGPCTRPAQRPAPASARRDHPGPDADGAHPAAHRAGDAADRLADGVVIAAWLADAVVRAGDSDIMEYLHSKKRDI